MEKESKWYNIYKFLYSIQLQMQLLCTLPTMQNFNYFAILRAKTNGSWSVAK